VRKIFLLVVIFSVLANAQVKEEFRGVWLTNVDSYVLATDNSIVEAMNYLSSMGINVIFPVVYNKGFTLYYSDVMGNLFNKPIINDASFQNRDFLERIIIEAHRVGIEVIPWFEFGFSSSYSQNGGHIVAAFPSWASKNSNGQLTVKNGFDWLSGINPEVQNFMISLVTEVIDKYDVDGVQGDDRLPALPYEGGYDSVTVAIYKSEHSGANPPSSAGDPSWRRWRADKLTQFLSRMRDSVKVRSPHLILSSSPTPFPWGYNEYLQDSKNWAKFGLVDNIIPQLYRYELSAYINTLIESISQVRVENPAIHFPGVLIKSGSYVITPELVREKIRAHRNRGIKGECFFFYEGLRANNNRIGDSIKVQFYGDQALLPYRNGNIWRPKGNIKNENEAGVTVSGTWENYQMAGFQGGVIRTNRTDEYAAVEYNLDIEFSAWYDVYGFMVPNTPWTKKGRYVIYSSTDSTVFEIDQSILNKRGWQKIGTAYLEKGTGKKVLKIDNTNLEAGRFLVADAVMLLINRKLSPDVVITTVSENENEIAPKSYRLEQNYPNPFNPGTRIRYSIKEEGKVELRVYDLLGREVRELVNEVKPVGVYESEFEGSDLTSGIYFYRMKVNNEVFSGKMMLIK
jgi:uncharacterized lipoprotein YddW (UPF0748 family)